MSEPTINATDAAVDLAAAHELNLAEVVGTGSDGRILKSDVEAHLADAENAEVPESTEVEEAEETAVREPAPLAGEATASPIAAFPTPEILIKEVKETAAATPAEPEAPEAPTFYDRVEASETLQELIALGSQAADETERTAVRDRAKELLSR